MEIDSVPRPLDAIATLSLLVAASGVPSSASVVRAPCCSRTKWLPSWTRPVSAPPIIGGEPTGISTAAASSSAAQSTPHFGCTRRAVGGARRAPLPKCVERFCGGFQQRFGADRRARRVLHPEVGRHAAVVRHPLELRTDCFRPLHLLFDLKGDHVAD